MKRTSIRQITIIIRWLARVTSLCSVVLIGMFLVGFNPTSVRPREWIGLLFFPFGVVVGMIIAWWKEGIGACTTLVSLFAFYAVYGWLLGSNVNSAAFIVFASPAFLFLLTSILSKSNSPEVVAQS